MEDIRSLDIKTAWNIFKSEIPLQSHEYQKARWGINTRFDINFYFAGLYTLKPNIGKIKLKGYWYNLEDVHTELDTREQLIKTWILQNVVPETTLTTKGLE